MGPTKLLGASNPHHQGLSDRLACPQASRPGAAEAAQFSEARCMYVDDEVACTGPAASPSLVWQSTGGQRCGLRHSGRARARAWLGEVEPSGPGQAPRQPACTSRGWWRQCHNERVLSRDRGCLVFIPPFPPSSSRPTSSHRSQFVPSFPAPCHVVPPLGPQTIHLFPSLFPACSP